LDATRLETGAGGRVQLSMTDLGQELIFEVQDQGPGIPESERQRIFEKGVSSKEGEARGYGLHLVQQFLGYWGGSVTVDNIPEGGSRFTLYLPKKPERRFES
ncbi:MAG: sensor histidine kinase, partial [Marinobacter adhaerens]|nr:sensor histidine kinase [Marinobacter adhaerens]